MSSTTTTLELNNPQGIGNADFLLIDKEIVKTTTLPTATAPFTVTVLRAQEGTQAAVHSDNAQIVKLGKQENASYIFPNPITPSGTTINLAQFSGVIANDDLLRLNKGTSSEEYVRVNQINTSDAQTFIITDGNVGTTALPATPKTTFSVITTSGNTFALGDVTIGFNDGVNSSTATGSTSDTSGGGNLKVHNSIELSGNTSTSIPSKQYFVITNGTTPKLYVESATGNTKLYDGANLNIFKDSFFTSGNFDKGRTDSANDIAFEVLGSTGNTKVAGTLTIGGNVAVKNTLSASGNTFTIDASNGDTFVGRLLTIGNAAASIPANTSLHPFRLFNLDGAANKSFIIRADASIDAFGKEQFYNKNGGRRTLYVSTTNGTVSAALETNVVYLVRPTANLTLNLPSSALTGDVIRFVDVGGALRYNVSLIINAPSGVKVQGNSDGGFGQLIVNTPNAAFGLVYVGPNDSSGASVASDVTGWWLMEI